MKKSIKIIFFFLCVCPAFLFAQVNLTKTDYCSSEGYGVLHIQFYEQDLELDDPIIYPIDIYWDNRTTNDYGYDEILVTSVQNSGNILKDIIIPSPGEYEVTIFFNDHCEAIVNITVLDESTGFTYIVENANESSCSDGNIDITITNGIPPYTIEWETPEETIILNNITGNTGIEDLSGLDPGEYSLTVTDNFCGEVTQDFEILCCGIHIQEPGIYGPSECNTSDGGFDFLTGAKGGVYPITGVWTDENGVVIENDGYTQISGLPSGIYHLTLTDAVGCTKVLTYHLVGQNEPSVVFDIMPACEGGTQGYIYVIAYNEVTNPTYTYTWSTGQVDAEADESEVFGLTAGVHTVTITDDNGSCEIVKDFIIPEVGPTFPLSLSSSYEIPCPGEANGSISLNKSGGVDPYTLDWNVDGVHGSHPSGLVDGLYTVTLTDYCGEEIVRSFNLQSLDATITSTSGCQNEGQMEVSVTGGTAPYTYLWDNGQTATIATNLETGNHTVTITDAGGCFMVKEIHVQNKEFEVEVIEPCEGFDDGELIIKIFNPNSENVEVLYSGTVPFPTTTEEIQEVQISNLNFAGTHGVTIIIGDCTYNYSIVFETEPTTLQFASPLLSPNPEETDLDTCFYNELCKGTIINPHGEFQIPFFDVNFAEGASFNKCFVPGFCDLDGDKIQVARDFYSKKWIRGVAYLQLLALAQTSDYYYASIIHLENRFYEMGFTKCSKFRYCPANLVITSTNFAFSDQYVSSSFSGGCEIAHCNGLFNIPYNVTSCIGDNLPIGNIYPPFIEDCILRQKNIYQLILWHQNNSLQGYYSNYIGSELFNFIEDVISDVELLNKAPCTTITFCLNDFSTISSNIQSYVCESFECYIEPTPEDPEIFIAYCASAVYPGGAYTHQFIYFSEFYGPDFLISPNTGNEYPVELYPSVSKETKFNKFGYVIGEDVTNVKGLLSSEGKPQFYDFTQYRSKFDFIDMPNFTQYIEDFEKGQYIAIENKMLDYSDVLVYEDTLSNWSRSVVAMDLDISYLELQDSSILLGGTSNGNIQYNSTVIIQSNTTIAFVLEISFEGDILDIQKVEDIDTNKKVFFENIDGKIGVTCSPSASAIFVGTETNNLYDSGDLINISNNAEGETNIQSSISLDPTRSVELKIQNEGGSKKAIMTKGFGGIKVNEIPHTILSNNNNFLLLSSETSTGLIWGQEFNLPDANPNEMSIVYGIDNILYVGLTFENTLEIQGNIISSEGGKDIVLLKFDEAGDLIDFLQYGSENDEVVNELFYDNNVLIFGGTFYGDTEYLEIGRKRIINSTNNLSNAYISYVYNTDFTEKSTTSCELLITQVSSPIGEKYCLDGYRECDELEIYLNGNLIDVDFDNDGCFVLEGYTEKYFLEVCCLSKGGDECCVNISHVPNNDFNRVTNNDVKNSNIKLLFTNPIINNNLSLIRIINTKVEEITTLEIIDARGVMLSFVEKINIQSFEHNVDLPAGVYFIKAKNSSGNYKVEKMMVIN